MYDLVCDVEIVFGLCKLLTAFENYVWNMRGARKTAIAVFRASLIFWTRFQDDVSRIIYQYTVFTLSTNHIYETNSI